MTMRLHRALQLALLCSAAAPAFAQDSDEPEEAAPPPQANQPGGLPGLGQLGF